LVSITDILLVSGIGLALFFREDLGKFLEGFKGFGQVNLPDVVLPSLPDVTINVPPLPDITFPELPDIGAGFEQAGQDISKAVEQAGIDITQFGEDVQKNIADSIAEAQKGIDVSIKETQAGFEQFGADVETNIGLIGTGITEFFGGLIPQKEITTISEATPTIISRRAGTETIFGGQTVPKEILTQETASTPELIISEQPDLSLVSPFLTTQKDPIAEPTLITSRRTLTTGGR